MNMDFTSLNVLLDICTSYKYNLYSASADPLVPVLYSIARARAVPIWLPAVAAVEYVLLDTALTLPSNNVTNL